MRGLGLAIWLFIAGTSAAQAAESCAPLPGVETLWARSGTTFVIVGELHGTTETPAAFGDLVCAAAVGSRPVVVALEQDGADRAALEAFLASDGGPDAVAALIPALSWQGPTWDGRSSIAMLDLMQRLRRMKADGRIVDVIAILDWSGRYDPQRHEQRMADALLAAAERRPDALILALTGNLHASKSERKARDGTSYRLAAGLLPADRTISLIVEDLGGSAWICRAATCGAQFVQRLPQESPRGIRLGSAPLAGFDGVLTLGGPISASPPVANF